MNAVVQDADVQISTQTAPSGPVDLDHRVPAENNPVVYVVYKSEFVADDRGGFPTTRFIGAYWNPSTALTVAKSFGGNVVDIEIGLIPLVTIKDIH